VLGKIKKRCFVAAKFKALEINLSQNTQKTLTHKISSHLTMQCSSAASFCASKETSKIKLSIYYARLAINR